DVAALTAGMLSTDTLMPGGERRMSIDAALASARQKLVMEVGNGPEVTGEAIARNRAILPGMFDAAAGRAPVWRGQARLLAKFAGSSVSPVLLDGVGVELHGDRTGSVPSFPTAMHHQWIAALPVHPVSWSNVWEPSAETPGKVLEQWEKG